MADIIGMNGSKIAGTITPVVLPGKFEFHFFAPAIDGAEEVCIAEGYLKFGPQFIAVVDGPEDISNVVYACATPIVRYVRRVTEEGTIEATLSPNG